MLRDVTLPSGEQRQIEITTQTIRMMERIEQRYPGIEYPEGNNRFSRAVVMDDSEIFWDVRDAAARTLLLKDAACMVADACQLSGERISGIAGGHKWQWLDEWLYEQLGMEVED